MKLLEISGKRLNDRNKKEANELGKCLGIELCQMQKMGSAEQGFGI